VIGLIYSPQCIANWNLTGRGQNNAPYEHIKDSGPPLAIKMGLLSLPFVKYIWFIANVQVKIQEGNFSHLVYTHIMVTHPHLLLSLEVP